MHLPELICKQLSALEARRIEAPPSRQAAVLMAFVLREEEPHFLLTRRTQTVATHKGQISFPGGVRETGDTTLIETALRETQEEIGVNRQKVRVLGQFHDYRAVTDHLVRPVVGMVSSEATFQPQLDEVAYLLEVPFGFFQETTPSVERRFRNGRFHDVYFYNYRGETVWGLTARMIRDFLELIR